MTGCSAPNCSNASEKGFTLVRFPTDAALRDKWREASGNRDWNPKPTSRLCEVHFTFADWGKFKFSLKSSAVPSVFCDCHDEENSPKSAVRSHQEHAYSSSTQVTEQRPFLNDITNKLRQESNVGKEAEINSISILSEHAYMKTDIPDPTRSTSTNSQHDHSYTNPVNDSKTARKQKCMSATNPKRRKYSHTPTCSLMDYEERMQREKLLQAREKQPDPTESYADLLIEQADQANAQLQSRVAFLEKELEKLKRDREKLQDANKHLQKSFKKANEVLKKIEGKHGQLSSLVQGKFSATQLAVAKNGTSKGRKWDDDTVRIALKIKAAGGSGGLQATSKFGIPLPSPRTLQRRLSHLKFEPGVQYEVLDAFIPYIKHFKHDFFEDCLIFIDDMAIKSGRCYDKGTDHYLGDVTLPGVTGDACKAQVALFGGVAANWRVLASYHFVPARDCAVATRDEVILKLLKKGKEMGLNIMGIVCDMSNRGLLNALGFHLKKDCMTYKISNPVDPTKTFFCIPDMVHVFKSVKEMFCNNRKICLPHDIVEGYQLPSPIADVSHVEWLVDYQKELFIKLHPKLSMDDIHTKHFGKMKSAPSRHVMSDKTSNALTYLVHMREASPECDTTAWFIRLLDKWAKVMTNRGRKLAFDFHNMDAYLNAIAVLRLAIHIFSNMTVGSVWKPVQTHLVMATLAVIDLQDYLLIERKYNYVLLGRFLQDVIENLFSLVRMVRPNPTAVELKYRLREIVVSQLLQRR